MNKLSTKTNREWCLAILDFLNGIGIVARAVPPSAAMSQTFTPHVLIRNGQIDADIENVFPGDILHEAGHVAVIPAPFRPLASGNLSAAFKAMHSYLDENPRGLQTYPEDPICRAILQCSDTEATAWQYAAAIEVGLPEHLLFPEGSYQGYAEENLTRLKDSQHFGINGLQAAGWTVLRAFPSSSRAMPPVFPKLAFWLHPAELPKHVAAG